MDISRGPFDRLDEASGTIDFEIPADRQGSGSGSGTYSYQTQLTSLQTCNFSGPLAGSFHVDLEATRDEDNLRVYLNSDYRTKSPGYSFEIKCYAGDGSISSGVDVPVLGNFDDTLELYVADGALREDDPFNGYHQEFVLHTACPIQLTRRDALPPLTTTPRISEEWPPPDVSRKRKAEIEALKRDEPGAGRESLGLTRAKHPTRLTPTGAEQDARFGGGLCYWVAKIEIHFPSIEMFIASNFPEESCEFKAIRKHEDKHYQSYVEIYRRYYQKIENALRAGALPVRERPLYVSSTDEGKQLVDTLVSNAVEPIKKLMRKDLENARRLLDLPSEYAKLYSSCPPEWDDY